MRQDGSKRPSSRPGAKRARIGKAQHRLRKGRGKLDDNTGIPVAVGRPQAEPNRSRGGVDVVAWRATWMLDLLAWARHGQVAPRVDLRGPRSPLPPVILPEAANDTLVCLDLLEAVVKLRSRKRAFSQVAGRYSPLVLGAREAGRKLVIEMWDLDGGHLQGDAAEGIQGLVEQLAEYLQAEVTLHGPADLAGLQAALRREPPPMTLVERNPVAWALSIAGDGET